MVPMESSAATPPLDIFRSKAGTSELYGATDLLNSVCPMLYRNVDQVISCGDLRIFHGVRQTHVCAVLELITAELGKGHTRILRVVEPASGKLGLAELINQIAGHPPSPTATAEMPTDGDVERAHHLLTKSGDGCDRILLLIEGAQSLRPAALRYIQQVCGTTPHLRLALVGSDTPAPLFEAEFEALSHRTATELRLDERAASAEACLSSALSPAVALGDTVSGTASVDAKALSQMLTGWTTSGPLLAASAGHRAGWRGRMISLSVVGVATVIGTAAWLFRDGGIEVEVGVMTPPVRVSQPLPTEPLAGAAPAKSSEELSRNEPAEKSGSDRLSDLAGLEDPPAAAALLEPPSKPGSTTSAQSSVPIAGDTPAGASAESSILPAEVVSPPQDVAASDRALQLDTLIPATETAAAAPSPAGPALAPTMVEVGRADHLLATGDISGARRWYEYAAARGSAIAATSLGKTYDPVVLAQWRRVGGIVAEPEKARFWYEKGAAMGDPGAAASLALLDSGH